MSRLPPSPDRKRGPKRPVPARRASADTRPGNQHHQGAVPPTISYRTFKGALLALKEHAGNRRELNARLSRCRMHSINRLDLLKAFQFLGLIDDSHLVTKSLVNLLHALDTPVWPPALRLVLANAYADLFRVSAVTLSGSALLPGFRATYATHADDTRKSAEFFIHAARDAAIEAGTMYVPARRARSATSQWGAPPPERANLPSCDAATEAVRALVSKFPAFDSAWADETKSIWLKAYVELTQRLPTAD